MTIHFDSKPRIRHWQGRWQLVGFDEKLFEGSDLNELHEQYRIYVQSEKHRVGKKGRLLQQLRTFVKDPRPFVAQHHAHS